MLKNSEVYLGNTGSGKTTLLAERLKLGASSRTHVVVNELGTVALDDLLLRSSTEAEVSTITGGCFGCVSLEHFLQVIDDARSKGAGHLILEGTGDAWGPEAASAFGQAKLPFNCAVTVNVTDFDADRALPVLRSQVQVANVAIVLTHLGNIVDLEDDRLAPLLAELAGWNAALPPVLLMPDPEEDLTGAKEAAQMLSELFARESAVPECSCCSCHDHHHGHDHEHHHHEHKAHHHTHTHGHDKSAVTVQLRSGVTIADLAIVLTRLHDADVSISRGKGIVAEEEGLRFFQIVNGRLRSGGPAPCGTKLFGVFMTNAPEKISLVREALSLIQEASLVDEDKSAAYYQLDNAELVGKAIEKVRREIAEEGPRRRDGRLRGRGEAATKYYYLGVNATRLGMQDLAKEALQAYVTWYLRALAAATPLDPQDANAAFNIGRLLCWAGASVEDDLLGPEQKEEIWRAHPLGFCFNALSSMSIAGLREDSVTQGDLFRWPENDAARIVSASTAHDQVNEETLRKSLSHGLLLVEAVCREESLVGAWRKFVLSF